MSVHRIDVISLPAIEKHPNADALGLVRIGGYTCAVRLGDYAEGDTVAYIEPDYVVPDAPLFAFLGGHRRIRARRLRGVWSQGLLIKPPAELGLKPGDDALEVLGIIRYEPPESPEWQSVKGPPVGICENVPADLLSVPKYDLENWRKYQHLFESGEVVHITEKIHGSNARYAFRDGQMFCGSRVQWRIETPKNFYWEGLRQNPWIEDWCRAHPEFILFGEVFGMQDLRYGMEPGKVGFLAFDVLQGNQFESAQTFRMFVPSECCVPLLYVGAYRHDVVEGLIENDSSLCVGQMAEGVVIKPQEERTALEIGRVALKCVGNRYLERAS